MSARFVYMMWAHLSASHKYPAHLLTQMTFTMFSVVSEFSFVCSLNSARYHEHYIGNSEWVYRERFRTQLKTARMTSENTRITVEDAPATFKSFVWQHFGYPAEMMNGIRVTDKTRTIPSFQWHTWSDSVCTICTLYWWSRTLIWFRR